MNIAFFAIQKNKTVSITSWQIVVDTRDVPVVQFGLRKWVAVTT
jgi:hypothetical protein